MFWLHLNDHWWVYFNFRWFYLKKDNHVGWKKMRCRCVLIPKCLGVELSWCRTVFFNGCRTLLFPTLTWYYLIRVITKLPNTEQSSKGKGKTHKSTNRQNQSTTGKTPCYVLTIQLSRRVFVLNRSKVTEMETCYFYTNQCHYIILNEPERRHAQ